MPKSLAEIDKWKPIFVNGVIPTEFVAYINSLIAAHEKKLLKEIVIGTKTPEEAGIKAQHLWLASLEGK